MKKHLSLLLAAVFCLSLLSSLPTAAADELDDIPQTLSYGGSTYQFISDAYYQKTYRTGTAYIFVVKSGSAYYALGSDLGAVGLRLQNGVLSANSGVAEVVPEQSDASARFTTSCPAKIGSQYLTITSLNGPLALSDTQAFQWRFTAMGSPDTLAVFYGSISSQDTSVSGCLTFDNGTFQTTQWGRMNENNLYIYQKACPHTHKEDFPAVAATCMAGGTAAHSYCSDCGSWLNEAGEYYQTESGYAYMLTQDSFRSYATGHHYVNGVCTYDSSHKALDYERVTPDMNLFEDGYCYIIATPDDGSRWKVMDIDPANMQGSPENSKGCTAYMGSDGKLRIDNTNDGERSAAEFLLVPSPMANDVLRVPATATYEDGYDHGLWAPDNGSDICVPITVNGYTMMDYIWHPGVAFSPHPYAILVKGDGTADIRMLTFSGLLHPLIYGSTIDYSAGSDGAEITCFFSPWDLFDESGSFLPTALSPNVSLFRAKMPPAPATHTWGTAMPSEMYNGVEISACSDCGKTRVYVKQIQSLIAGDPADAPVLDGSGQVTTISALTLDPAHSSAVHVVLTSDAFQNLRNELSTKGAEGVTIRTNGTNSITLDGNAVTSLGTVSRMTGQDFAFSLQEIAASAGTAAQKAAVQPYLDGGASLYRVGFNDVASFDGIATVSLPAPGGVNQIAAYAVAEDGTLSPLPSFYDETGKTLLFALSGSADCLVVPMEQDGCTMTARISGGTLEYTIVSGQARTASLVAAYYDGSGRMTGQKTVPVTLNKGTNRSSVSVDASHTGEYRVFLLDGSLRPLCAAWKG